MRKCVFAVTQRPRPLSLLKMICTCFYTIEQLICKSIKRPLSVAQIVHLTMEIKTVLIFAILVAMGSGNVQNCINQAPEHIMSAFHCACDLDNNQIITMAENEKADCVKFQEAVYGFSSLDQVKSWFNEQDKNGDGTVEMTEFMPPV